jgi:hypothetical protein
MSSSRARWYRAAVASLVVLLASCSSADSPAGPADPIPSLASSPEQQARKAEHERLMEQRKALREEFKAQREATREQFKAARDEWRALNKDLKARKKAGTFSAPELLSCEPREYTGDAEVIGPDGGSIVLGSHRLTIPKGALDHEVLISGKAPISTLVEVELEPHGLTFARPAELSLDYSGCLQPPEWAKVFMVYLDAQEQVLEVTISRDKKGIKEVVGDLEHFSRYSLAW